jgi:hypothetical protein
MVTFTSFSDLLPDPNNKINSAGASDSSGTAGPGFAKIKFTSENNTQMSRTISGRGVAASPGFHKWSFDISYNPMTRDEFDPVASFLESRRGRLNPFYVILPQHAKPRDSDFNTFLTTTGRKIYVGWYHSVNNYSIASGIATVYFSDTKTIPPFNIGDSIGVTAAVMGSISGTSPIVTECTTSYVRFAASGTVGLTAIPTGNVKIRSTYIFPAGSSTLQIRGGSGVISTGSPIDISGTPSPGDFFTITDPDDTNHKKTYKVIRVEDNITYQADTLAPNTTQKRIHFVPPLARGVSRDSEIVFINPKFRVIQKGDTLEYDLDTDNLYQFSLSLEEIQP